MHRAERKTASQRRIGPGMTERRPVRRGSVVGFDALDAAAQGRKRARACAGHAPLLKMCPPRVWTRNQKLAHLFMICSNIKLRAPTESIGIVVIASESEAIQRSQEDWIASSQVLLE